MPLCLFSGSVMAKSSTQSAAGPLVMKFLVPESTHSPPRFSARVFCAPASLPASGSESAKQPSFSPRASGASTSRFCRSLPNLRIGSQTSELLTDMITAVEAQATAISSSASV